MTVDAYRINLTAAGVKATAALFFIFFVMSAIFAESDGFSMVDGKNDYDKHCRACHGGKGVRAIPGASDLARGLDPFRSDSELLAVIQSGVRGMPAYIGVLTEDEIRNIVMYLRVLN